MLKSRSISFRETSTYQHNIHQISFSIKIELFQTKFSVSSNFFASIFKRPRHKTPKREKFSERAKSKAFCRTKPEAALVEDEKARENFFTQKKNGGEAV
jgi:hypothetical protein